MAQEIRSPAQLKPAAATVSTLYTVPPGKSFVGSTIVACNQSATPDTVRIGIAIAGVADADKQWIAYDAPVEGNDAEWGTAGITLGPGDVVRVRSTNGTTSFSLFGVENDA